MESSIAKVVGELKATYGETVDRAIDMVVEFQKKMDTNDDYMFSVIDRHFYITPKHSSSFDFGAQLIIDVGTAEIIVDTEGVFGDPKTIKDVFAQAIQYQKAMAH